MPLRVMPDGRFRVAPVRFVPLKVTGTVAPRAPEVGATELSVGAGGLTVKVTALLVPPAAVTVMLRAPVAALASITRVAVICVAVATGVPLRVRPDGRFRVEPVRFAPVKITGTVAPWTPDVGAMEASVGVGGLTVKATALLVPPGVVTVMLWAPVAALAPITREAVICVAVATGVPLTVMPDGRFRLAPVRFVPVRVTGSVAPWTPEVGAMEVSVGAAGLTVNVTALLVPPPVVTEMFWAPVAVVDPITREAVICVAVTAGVPLTLMPDGRFRLAPVRYVPVRVTGTVAP